MKQTVLTVTLNAAIDWTVTVPDFAAGQVNRAAGETKGAGGKGINVASILADFGLRVAATGFLGRDNEEPFRQLFASKGIEDRMVRLDGSTRMGIKIVGGPSGGTTDINFPGLAPSHDDLVRLSEVIRQSEATWIVLAGSTPPGVSAEIYRDLSREARSWGRRVALDASGEALRCALEAPRDALPHLIKPNLAELEEWAGSRLTTTSAIVDAANQLVERGVERVAVSLGSEGMILVSRHGAVRAVPPVIEVGSTVGAGDALVAGLVAASIADAAPTESAVLGTAFSVDALTATTGYGLSRQALEKWEGQIAVQSVPLVRGSPKPSIGTNGLPKQREPMLNLSVPKLT